MKRIQLVSTEKHAGKSLLALALGRSLQERGLTVAYMKPISFEVSYTTGAPIDQDAAAVRSLLSLNDDLHDIAPVPLEGPFLREAIEYGDRGFRDRITAAFGRIAKDRDAAIIEGRTYLGLGVSAGLSDLDLADLLATDVILLARYNEEESIDQILCALRLFEGGPRILGVVLRDVPVDRSLAVVEEVLIPFLADRGAEVLGMIPHDPNTRAVATEEIAKRLGGRILGSAGLDHEVRHFVVGALGTEASMRTFRRTPDLAVITGGDRTEILNGALDVPGLRCLILTGNQRPAKEIVDRANAVGVPGILAGQNTMITAALCSEMLDRVWIRPGPTLDRAIDHVRSNIDVDRVMEKAADH
jgi:BioD-like phosphotransacetylase family protein